MHALRLKTGNGIGMLGLIVQPIAVECARPHISSAAEKKYPALQSLHGNRFVPMGYYMHVDSFRFWRPHQKGALILAGAKRAKGYFKWRGHLKLQPFTGALIPGQWARS